MTTKTPASVKEASPDEPVKKIYNMVEEFKDVIPITNERYRLAYCVNKFFNRETNSLKEALTSANPESCTIERNELLKQLTEKYNKLGLKHNE
jgi:hypothetical protein